MSAAASSFLQAFNGQLALRSSLWSTYLASRQHGSPIK